MHHRALSRKEKQAVELQNAAECGYTEWKLYLFPNERRFWQSRGLNVILIANHSKISSSCIVSEGRVKFADAVKHILTDDIADSVKDFLNMHVGRVGR